MKWLVLIVFGAGIVAGSAYYVSRAGREKTSTLEALPAWVIAEQSSESPQPAQVNGRTENHIQVVGDRVSIEPRGQAATGAALTNVRQAVDTLTSPGVSYNQKREVWKQLKENGGLDQAIHELEQRLAGDLSNAQNVAVLGHAYIQKCAVISDVREQGILAMQADKLFDTALNLDPSNWEARFTKAVALSYWPPNMGKGEEVLQQFTTLAQQQETQSPQPEFADTYMWLGEQYQKSGRNEDAQSVWERGAFLFPGNEKLKSKLASSR
jgi:tetratricopeptide (TPR) repeat protein